MDMEWIDSNPLNGFLTRSNSDGTKCNTTGTFLAASVIHLSSDLDSDHQRFKHIEKENQKSHEFEQSSSIELIIKAALFGNNQLDSLFPVPSKAANNKSFILILLDEFVRIKGVQIRVNYVQNHSTLVESVKESESDFLFCTAKRLINNDTKDQHRLPTFNVDVSLFLSNKHITIG